MSTSEHELKYFFTIIQRVKVFIRIFENLTSALRKNVSKYGVISGPYFPVFGLNTEIYDVNPHILFEYRKIRTRNSSVFGQFSRSAVVTRDNNGNDNVGQI